jgi:hypothetical protein
MFLRFMLNAILTFVKEHNFDKDLVQWYRDIILKQFMNAHKSENAVVGIPLQISEVLVEEMNKVAADEPLDSISTLL